MKCQLESRVPLFRPARWWVARWAVVGAFVLAGCGESTEGVDAGAGDASTADASPDSGPADAEVDGGGGTDAGGSDVGPSADGGRDVGPRPDAGGSDAGAPDVGPIDSGVVYDLGHRVGALDDTFMGFAPSATEGLFLRADGVHQVDLTTGDDRALGHTAEIWFRPSPARPVLYAWDGVDALGMRGRLVATNLRAGSATIAVPLAARSATGVLIRSDDGEWALATDDLEHRGGTSTATADLVLVRADGTQRSTVFDRVALGPWSEEEGDFTGDCANPPGVFTSSTTALFMVCRDPARPRLDLFSLDLRTLATATVATDVLSFLSPSPSGEFVVFAKIEVTQGAAALNLYGASSNGAIVTPLAEDDSISGIQHLDGRRFAYSTARKELLVASWPDLMPSVLQPFGVGAIEGVSPGGEWLMFQESESDSGLRNLFVVPTATTAVAEPLVLSPALDNYPGDDAFSADGALAFYFARADDNYIGEATSRPTAGGPEQLLATRAFYLYTFADPGRVMMMVNTRLETIAGGNYFIADLATRASDGSDRLRTLAAGVYATRFDLAPDGARIVFRVLAGPSAGYWARALD